MMSLQVTHPKIQLGELKMAIQSHVTNASINIHTLQYGRLSSGHVLLNDTYPK